MNLISLQFGVFLLIALAVYYVLPMNKRWWALLASSAAFFALAGNAYTIVYLAFSAASVYYAARRIESAASTASKKKIFLLVLLCNMTLLCVFKYMAGFWSSGATLLSLIGISLPPYPLTLLAPLGMSFYTLQLIGYLTDVYWGIYPAERNFAKVALFAAYFPSISSGPILRYNQVADDLFEGHKASYRNLTYGLQRMLWGLFKKMVIAERLAAIARPVFAAPDTYYGVWIWLGLAAAVIQIYADFSGNMDFILGASECFGVRLPENFRQPFFSLTIQEFWQRWHISLGGWLKDYIMYPLLHSKLWKSFGKTVKKRLGKKAAKLIPTFSAMFVLWLCNGVWHSPYPKYLATVMWFWIAVTGGQLLEPFGKKLIALLHIQTDCTSWRLFQRIRTIAVYSVGALFFCSNGIRDALHIAKNALKVQNVFHLMSPATFFSDAFLELAGQKAGVHILILSLLLLIAVETFQNRGGHLREWLEKQNLVFRWIVLLGLIFTTLLFGVYGPGYSATEFIYAGF